MDVFGVYPIASNQTSRTESVARVASEDHHPVRGNYDRGRRGQTMHRRAGSRNRSAVARDHWIDEVIVNVTVEDLEPLSLSGKTDLVAVPRRLVERCHHDNVASEAGNPALKCDDAILIMNVEHVDRVAAQGGVAPFPAPNKEL